MYILNQQKVFIEIKNFIIILKFLIRIEYEYIIKHKALYYKNN